MIRFRPPFTDDWSAADIYGESAEAATSMLVSRLLNADYEVQYFDDETGDWTSYGDDDAEG